MVPMPEPGDAPGFIGNWWFCPEMRSGFPAAVPGLAAGNHPLVEAGGQHIHGFRRGLDYAFIRALR